MVKPFSADQLDARIRAVLRRVKRRHEAVALVVGGSAVDVARPRVATLDGATLDLARKEFDLLDHLAGAAGQGGHASASCWPRCGDQPYGGADKTIDVHLSWLRRKLGETAAEPRYLHTVRGVGVKLVAPEQ